MTTPSPRERGILETMERDNRVWEVPGKRHYTLYNDKTGRDRIVSHAIVEEMARAGWIQRADHLPQRLESWEITEAGRALISLPTKGKRVRASNVSTQAPNSPI
jgi:hypothetical protein